jgi:transglutaminase-like putative cysteine protease
MTRASIDDPVTPWTLRLILADDPRPLPWAVWTWARNDIRFHEERPHVVASLRRLLDAPVGDCNDLTIAVTALAHAGRVPVRWALGFDRTGEPVHIWAQLMHQGEWLDVDPSPGAPPPGAGKVVDVPGTAVVGYDVIT